MSYPIPAAGASAEELVKKSRFITLLAHTTGLDEAKAFWQQCREQHPGARHWCFAAVAGHPTDGQQYAMSDDGEPAGTAGKPMLAQLLGSGVGEISAVVVRYYGGVKLGTGGLVKAYGGGVGAALKLLPTRLYVPQAKLVAELDYALQSQLDWLLGQFDGRCIDTQFGEKLNCTLTVPLTSAEAFGAELKRLNIRFSAAT
ncbi:YigZ family protein [Gallaecimonas pentaromativorans]|uniref:YigZ family protein n=1 Tax=Gallaecimonas pentaromativorans TaxID=584787 RepID=UPI003A8F2B3A